MTRHTTSTQQSLVRLLKEILDFDDVFTLAVIDLETYQRSSAAADVSILTVEAARLTNMISQLQPHFATRRAAIHFRLLVCRALRFVRAYEVWLNYSFALKYDDCICLFCELKMGVKWRAFTSCIDTLLQACR
ncbi:hypothetical protein LTR10_001677 [Elasticomyces elasticus]|nr:hypothetical protein LTR10_001677 [Elasticomyces elasticus]